MGRRPFVRHDEPTLPDFSDTPTVLDARHRKPQRPPPMWPIPQRVQQPAARGHSPFGWVIATALAASAVLLLSLLTLLGVINLTSGTGIFPPSKTAGQSATAASTASTAASPAPTSGWLQAPPATVQFGCSDHQRTQIVVLENRGPTPVHWQASLSVPADQAGRGNSPVHCELGAGESTGSQLENTSQAAPEPEGIR